MFTNSVASYTLTSEDSGGQGIYGATTSVTLSGSQPVTLLGPNTYGGTTTLGPGSILVIADNNSLGASTAPLVFNGATLQYTASDAGNTDISSRPVTFLGGATIDLNGNSVAFANSVGGGGAGSLTVVNSAGGAATLTINAAANYTGGTNIQNGTLRLGITNALPTASDTLTLGLGIPTARLT